jgi:Nicotine adenine dinucleotide glycohydrolase (NADase)/Double zinc ribbon
MSSAQCPQCARPVTTSSDKFCTSCGSALSWVELPADGGGRTTGAPSFACPACRELNPASRLLCQRCGALLEPAQAPLPASLAPGAPWRWRAPLLLLAIAAVAALAAAMLGAALKSDGRLSLSAPSVPTTARAAAAPAPVKLDPRSISASASSELPPADTVTYSIRNTLDGNRRTAWNNHSAVDGSGIGETLTYRFSSPVHLVRIDVVNGYAKTAKLRADNGRIRGAVIGTDRRTVRASFSDTTARQRLDRDFGMTREVTLQVTSIYPGARYTDLALTEIAFWAAPR